MSHGSIRQSDLNEILGQLSSQGWRIVPAKHIKCYPPDKTKPMVVIARSCGGGRGYKNMVAQLRNSGAIIE